jgi:hypothetical protein
MVFLDRAKLPRVIKVDRALGQTGSQDSLTYGRYDGGCAEGYRIGDVTSR